MLFGQSLDLACFSMHERVVWVENLSGTNHLLDIRLQWREAMNPDTCRAEEIYLTSN